MYEAWAWALCRIPALLRDRSRYAGCNSLLLTCCIVFILISTNWQIQKKENKIDRNQKNEKKKLNRTKDDKADKICVHVHVFILFIEEKRFLLNDLYLNLSPVFFSLFLPFAVVFLLFSRSVNTNRKKNVYRMANDIWLICTRIYIKCGMEWCRECVSAVRLLAAVRMKQKKYFHLLRDEVYSFGLTHILTIVKFK